MKTHWKKLQNPDYFGAWCIDEGKDMTVTIEKVVHETVKGPDGEKDSPVAYLKGQKPLILNATNSKMIARVLGSSYVEDWTGKMVTLYSTRVKAYGEMVDAVRVRSTAPKLPKPTADDWDKIVEAVRGGKASVEQAQAKYTLTAEQVKLLQK
ncbi:MAG TPA: hypothetical protein VKP88_07985 [Candidatus Paceibacterota bacterium]|nr:hypothetical protein [Candidatus Paceibacterota bacterium]